MQGMEVPAQWTRRVFVGSIFLFSLLSTEMVFSQEAAEEDVGYLEGKLDIQNGAASYLVPVKAPAGIAGMQPEISFVYNSQSGNGVMGLGWNIAGLSVISRCSSTYVQDGIRRNVKGDDDDKFCLDGQKLIAINDGTYGADLTEYKTEIDGFSKIISYERQGSGPSYFKVWTKAGQVFEYGSTEDSRLEVSGGQTVLSWSVSSITDSVGNEIAFHIMKIMTHSNSC
jgi:hypothetical protein